MRTRATTQLLIGAVGLATLVGCGSTVPLSAQQSGLQNDGLAPATSGPATGTAADGTTAGGIGSATGGTAAGPASAGSQLPAGSTSRGDGPATLGSGGAAGTAAPVKVGFFVSQDVGKTLSTFGLNGLSSGNGANQAAAATALVNSLGGLDGHPIKPVVYVNGATTDPNQESSQEQAACETFFTDNKVVAVVSVLPVEVVSACANKHHVPLSVSGISTLSSGDLARFPNIAMPNQIAREHGIDTLIPALVRGGYFRPRSAGEVVKIGLVTNGGRAGFVDVPSRVQAALKKQGLELTATATISTIDKGSGEASAAVLQFQAKGINHVIAVDDHGGPMTFFMLAAQSQGYYPRMGLSSYEIPQVAAGVFPARQFQDAVGVGWLPTTDVALSDADKTLNVPAKRCMAAMTRAGEDMSSSGSRGIALGVCDSLLALRAAVAGRGLQLSGYLSGLRALGRSYPSTMTFSTDFTHRRDGADQVRLLGYDASCTCFHYTGPLFRP